ncbi:ATP-dependent protease ATPase subunit HslU [Cohnella lubricantis]|uniref:ATP-dependent protease ATPase subunit HslU n=2 Tax=Cohnella lubricantis TaxID=2163172 RepID=A0A841TD91_9BACL|nr:ATP-dependent protease ATPase subunit HslU [Cohnella lubricantis]MBP2117505.1 ATP-dependent HslUV protease ATP-binding subunit HslU [Cohnella lubricantis]
MNDQLTPRTIVAELDKYIVGQKQAKRSVAVALRNRFRRSSLPDSVRDEIVPKNILMIGPTGVGKTEIARRLAKLVQAPFVKVEATKFTEVGYVGRDVESMVRDLVETAIRMVKEERMELVKDKAEEAANERLALLLAPSPSKPKSQRNPLEMLFGGGQNNSSQEEEPEKTDPALTTKRADIRAKLAAGSLENEIVEIDVEDAAPPMLDMFAGAGQEQLGQMQEMFSQFMPKRRKKRKLSVKEARKVLAIEEAGKLIDMDDVVSESVRRAEQSGIIFIDEIDKIASGGGRGQGPDVSREGVQRDILPIVEGSTVVTKYGPIKTDYILFVAAGAFHVAKPSDLIPELQGRFPIRVELTSLTDEDFVRILTEPENALTKQYAALLQTEGIEITFTDEAIAELAKMAQDVNRNTENIGARRLHTLLEKLLEDLSFEAPELTIEQFSITPEYVREKLSTIASNRDLSQYIL